MSTQARAPKGVPNGGQWTSASGVSGSPRTTVMSGDWSGKRSEKRGADAYREHSNPSFGDEQRFGFDGKPVPEGTPNDRRFGLTEKEALQSYTGPESAKVNHGLRRKEEHGGYDERPAAMMDHLMSKAKPLKSDVTVYRGLAQGSSRSQDAMINDVFGGPIAVGSRFQDKGFLSTSVKPKIATGFRAGADLATLESGARYGGITLRIDVPKGTKALKGTWRAEKELIFNRNSNFVITGIENLPNGGLGVRVRMEGP